MDKQFFFTINLLIKSDTNIKNAISSVIGDEKFFLQHTQLVLIDTIGSTLSTEVCTEYSSKYPDNVFFVDAIGESVQDGYNHASALWSGQYVAYIDNYGTYSPKALSTVYSLIKSGKVPVFCIRPMRSVPMSEDVPYLDGLAGGTVHLKDTPDTFILFLGAYFLHRKIADKVRFDHTLRFHYDVRFLIDVLMKTYHYVYSERCSYTSSYPCEHDVKRYEPQYSGEFYTKAVDHFIIPMLESCKGVDFVMYIMMYLMEIKFVLNMDDDYKKVLIGSHVTGFFNSCSRALQYIDDTVILNRRLCMLSGIDEEMPLRFIRMKRNDPALLPDIDIVSPKETIVKKYRVSENRIAALPLNGEFVCHIDGVLLSRSKNISADIQILNADSEGMYFDAVLNGCSYLNEDDFSIYAMFNGEKLPVLRSEVYTLTKYFDQAFLKKYAFRFFLPFRDENKIDVASLYFRFHGLTFRMHISFDSIHAKLNDEMKSTYAQFGSKVLTYDKKSKSLVIKQATDSLVALCETRLKNEIMTRSGIKARFYYNKIRKNARLMDKNAGKKRIVLFYEDKGINDNGCLLFRYFCKHPREEFTPYICVRRDSPEYRFLIENNYENVLEKGSPKAKTVALAAALLFAEDCDPYDSIGFQEDDTLYLRDMMMARTISAKSYFMTYETAQYNNRLRDNTQLVFCASNREKENLLAPVYDYEDSMIRVAGNALLDAVSAENEKIILIAPGKRKLFRIYENSSYYRFTESSFFKAYNGLLSDRSLLDACKEKGWKIAVLMPRSIEKYASLFPENPCLTVYPYNEQTEAALLARASVLVTDYSDLQYRFAYLEKSVLYFFPQGLPINSEHKGEGIIRNGFGDVLFEKEELCQRLISGMENDFAVTDKYRQRRLTFFGKSEKGNCRRIYEETIRILRSL